MAKKKYTGEPEIRHKIEELFTYRKLIGLLQQGGLDKDKVFYEHLVDIQYQIYLLDAYLEGAWDLDKAALASCWEKIKDSLSKLNYSSTQIDQLLREIREYERIERNCRKGKWPTKVSFRKFYTTKSCDVRLIRHLIYDAQPELKRVWKEKDWTYYDLITEMNDDIADVVEDLNTYNGNRFLISVLRKGSVKTEKQYRAYMEKTTSKAKEYFKKHGDAGDNQQLYTWTMERSVETLDLLAKTVHTNDPSLFSKSLLLSKMK
ncbi:MAG TPA: hypothetical protein VLA46_12685 [Saprospiraceae bacterium]|nr:hypothetical protein [Saprospiraceae bacterium]